MILRVAAALAGAAVLAVVFWDAFETIVLPREVGRRARLARGYFVASWSVWRSLVRLRRPGPRREAFLGLFGPLSLLVLIQVWLVALVVGFALVHWGAQTELDGGPASLPTYLYLSGTTFLTLGLGDIIPTGGPGRLLTVVEAGAGLGFLALLIGYVPVIYGAFSRREVAVSQLVGRAGTPPTAVGLLSHYRRRADGDALERLLERMEVWAVELQEAMLSYPVLATYRSQRRGRSWLQAVTLLLDTCALLLATGVDQDELDHDGEGHRLQAGTFDVPLVAAELGFEAAGQLVHDLVTVLRPGEHTSAPRLAEDDVTELCAALGRGGLPLLDRPGTAEALHELRRAYEPGVRALSAYLLLDLPPWVPRSVVASIHAGATSSTQAVERATGAA